MLLRWTTSAARDLSEICDYIEAQDGAESARLLAERILEELEALLRFPQSGRPGRELRTRELVFRRLPYIAVYRVRGEAVEVTRIFHGAREFPPRA